MTRDCRIPFQGIAFVLGCAVAALCIDLSRYHEMQHADALIPVMVSLYKWDLFYWGQSRLGMLLPLLAAPIDHPFWNLIVQNGVGIFGCLAVMGCLSWYLLRDRTWAAAGALGALLLIATFPFGERFHMMNGSQPYAIPMALATLAITAVAQPGRRVAWRWVFASAITAVAYWYHFGIGPQIAVLAGGRFLYQLIFQSNPAPAGGFWSRVRRSQPVFELACAAALTLFGTAVGSWLMSLSPYPQPEKGMTGSELWVKGWTTLYTGLTGRFGECFGYLSVGLALGAVWLLWPATRAAAVRCWGIFGLAAGWLGFQFAFAGTLQWVNFNDYDIRYLYAGLIAVAAAVAIVSAAPVLTVYPKAQPVVTACLALALPGAAVVSYGVPSVEAARTAVDRATGHHTRDILDSRCTHILGDYWPVWAATFHANMTLADRGERRILWAVTHRGGDVKCCWPEEAPVRLRVGYIAPPGAPPAKPKENEWNWAFTEIEEVERSGSITVYRVK